MLARIIEEATDAVAAAVRGVDNILDAITGSVKDQVVNVLKGTGEVAGTGVEAVASVASGAVRGAGHARGRRAVACRAGVHELRPSPGDMVRMAMHGASWFVTHRSASWSAAPTA